MNISYDSGAYLSNNFSIDNGSLYNLVYIDTHNNSYLRDPLADTEIVTDSSDKYAINEVELMVDNDDYRSFRDQSRFWIQRVLVPMITLIGVLGNGMTIVIMTRRRMRSSTNLYLAALAIFDTLYLIFTFVLSLSHYPNSNSSKYYYYWLLWPTALFICDLSSNVSIWLTVTFTIERYIVVCHPIKGKIFFTYSRARNLIVLISLFISLVTLPTVFEWKTATMIAANNQTIVELRSSDLGLNTVYKRTYYWLTVIMFVFIPLLLLAVFNMFLIRSVRLSNRRRKTLTKTTSKQSEKSCLKTKSSKHDSSRQESHITIMLIAVVILFLVCQLPSACILIYTAFSDSGEDRKSGVESLIRGLGNIFNLLVAINSAGNFVLYCMLSQKYRRTFRKTFCQCVDSRRVLRRTVQKTVQTNVAN